MLPHPTVHPSPPAARTVRRMRFTLTVAVVLANIASICLAQSAAAHAIPTTSGPDTRSVIVDATAVPWLAGRASSQGIGTLPPAVDVRSGATITFPRVAGTWSFGGPEQVSGDGDTINATTRSCGGPPPCVVEPSFHISGIKDDQRFWFLAGVFLGKSQPSGPPPAMLSFTNRHGFTALSPRLAQVFFIGNGRTSSGQLQQFRAPTGATRLYLGMADVCQPYTMANCYFDNSGQITVTTRVAPADSWQAAGDFSAVANPNGTWSYGWSNATGSTFVKSLHHLTYAGVDIWSPYASPPFEPDVFFNPTDSVVAPGGTNPIPPHGLAFHPGPNGENATVRWTAPRAGFYGVAVTFTGRDTYGTTTGVGVRLSGDELWRGEVSGYLAERRFRTQLLLDRGATVDFTVGFGVDGNYFFDSTGLNATITEETGAWE